jgi:NTP pyrophosphatase (non-canonical NTP hydrolase)
MTTESFHKFVGKVIDEAESAQESFGDFASMHEAYGVLAEEVAELFEAVRLRQGHPERLDRIAHEAMQVAAVAARMGEQASRVLR